MGITHRIANIRSRDSKFVVWFFQIAPLVLCSAVLPVYLLGGCENANSKKPSLVERLEKLEQEKGQLTRQIQHTQAENEQLRKQLQVLSGIPPEVKPENIYNLQRIKITRYTNFYDKDKDGQREKLIVYIQPIDADGDIIKAAGRVDVQLWDLNAPRANQALLGQWRVKPGQLRKLWFATLLSTNYRLTFDIANIIKDLKEPLTVKVTFTDHLTGKVFKEQRVIKP